MGLVQELSRGQLVGLPSPPQGGQDVEFPDLQAMLGETAFAGCIEQASQTVDPRPHRHRGGREIGTFPVPRGHHLVNLVHHGSSPTT